MGRWKMRTAGLAAAGLTAFALMGAGAGLASAQGGPGQPVATIPNLTGVSTSVKLDSGFTDALTSLKVTPAPIGDATVSDGTAKFPITGGNVTVYNPGEAPPGQPFVQGSIKHEGSGLSLTKGDTKVSLEDFVVDPGQPATLKGKVSANGKTVAESVTLFDLDGSTLQPLATDAAAGTATLTGTTVRLSSDAATALNGAFSTDAIKGGTTVGVATIVVKLPGQADSGSSAGGSSAAGGSAGGGGAGGSGAPSTTPSGGAKTGGGSTAGIDVTLLAGGLATVLAGAGVAVAVRRRTSGQR